MARLLSGPLHFVVDTNESAGTTLVVDTNEIAGTTLVSQDTNVNPLDGCLHVYLDVGSNRGIQVRKLFEPNLFPKATKFLNLIDKYFGEKRNSSQVCAVGFEPNPVHEDHLLRTAGAYNKCGWRVLFHTRTGVAKAEIFQDIFINSLDTSFSLGQF